MPGPGPAFASSPQSFLFAAGQARDHSALVPELIQADAVGRLVVVSPHLDDGVLSLGAAISEWARRGATVELLTVFACDPDSAATVGGWDGRAGFRTEGKAARARREEDRRACEILGATPVWLPFGSVDFERHGDEEAVRAAVEEVLAGADVVLVPGFPLSHPDHKWLLEVLARSLSRYPTVGLYAEQPYAMRANRALRAPEWLDRALGRHLSFGRVAASPRHRLAKWKAIRRYRSQLPLLGMSRSLRRGPHAVVLAGESVAWLDAPGGSRD